MKNNIESLVKTSRINRRLKKNKKEKKILINVSRNIL